MRNKQEEILHKSICEYIKLQYPNILFKSDLSGEFTTMNRAKKNKEMRSNKGFPDLEILHYSEIYNGLFIEFKKESPYKKDGFFKKSKHLQEQIEVHKKLRLQNYYVRFAWEFEEAKKIIDDYMK